MASKGKKGVNVTPFQSINLERYTSYNEFTPYEVSIIMEILSIFDNRHDFKQGARNQSLSINEVLALLAAKASKILGDIDRLPENLNKRILFELLTIHCMEIAASTLKRCKTPINPDSKVVDFMFKHIFKEPISSQKVSYNNGFVNKPINKRIIRFGTKEAIAEACNCSIDGKDKVTVKAGRNKFLDSLLQQLSEETGFATDKIKFCIDVSNIGEWVFRHDGIKTSSSTHLVTIADDYDTFRKNSYKTVLPSAFSLEKNHIALKSFDVTSSQIAWNKNNKINLVSDNRAGVARMAEAIRIVLDSKGTTTKAKSKQAALEIISDIFGTIPGSPMDYGKHIMDFKRLMDTTKLAVTQLFNATTDHLVILVTHDRLLFLLAKMVQCPVILTVKNPDHSREMYIDIPISREHVAKKKQEQQAIYDAFWKTLGVLPSELPIVEYTLPSTIPKDLPIETEELFMYILNVFVKYLNEVRNKLIDPSSIPQVTELGIEYKRDLLKTIIESYKELVSKLNVIIPTIQNSTTALQIKVNILNDVLNKFNSVSNTGLLKHVHTMLRLLKIFTDPSKKLQSNFNIVITGTQVKQTEYTLKREILSMLKGGTPLPHDVADDALDFLYKYITKNIERYYSLPAHMQTEFKELEPLFEEFIKADTPLPKRRRSKSAVSQQPLQKKAITNIPPPYPLATAEE